MTLCIRFDLSGLFDFSVFFFPFAMKPPEY
jgi:hypothetical protein